MDVADDILKRGPRADPSTAFMADMDPASLIPDYDCIYVIEWQGERDTQPVVWPMLLHKHTDECGRA